MELVGLLVKIGIKAEDDGKGSKKFTADYPDFNSLSIIKNAGIDWSYWVDREGGGWHYDKALGHKESGPDSPYGQQWGMLLVPEAFADQAVDKFPECSLLTEADAIDFYDNKAHAHESDQKTDVEALEALDRRAGQPATHRISAEVIAKMLDPNDPTPGIRTNHRKTFALMSAHTGITLKP